ncbi:uncharacterized protein LOC126657311 [Mercurialis annua]|uniref:uncharacterized protein LOC126657311 n=1 Tax=Mercurialis annua TaxID=3986 RepID=UPI00215EA52F|nr:uncharacterized protein LOC126657311 [Mercurialis annua]
MGTGLSTRFWVDPWAANEPLKLLYPGLFTLSRFQQQFVADLFDYEQQVFLFSWKRRLRLGEQTQLSSLASLVEANLPTSRPDQFYWNGKLFSPSAFVRTGQRLMQNHNCNFGRFWKYKIPPCINFFMWLLNRDRISSNAMLVRRGVLTASNSSCLFCSEEETSSHIILHCRFAWNTWNLILKSCNLQWAAPVSVHNYFDMWSYFGSKRYRSLWQTIWFFGIWELWKARNARVFRHEIVDINSLVYSIICKAVIFYKDNNAGFDYSANDVFRNLNLFCNFL